MNINMLYYRGARGGFTLIEIIIVIGIAVIITTITLASLPALNAQSRTKAGAETALRTVRDARNRSVAIAEFPIGAATPSFPSYGAFFTITSPQQITLYADCKLDDTGNNVIDHNDDFRFATSVCPDPPGPATGLVENILLDSRVKIKEIRRIVPGATTITQQTAHVEFLRPEPSSWISTEGSPAPPTILLPLGRIEIDITDTNDTFTKTIVIWTTGHMEVK